MKHIENLNFYHLSPTCNAQVVVPFVAQKLFNDKFCNELLFSLKHESWVDSRVGTDEVLDQVNTHKRRSKEHPIPVNPDTLFPLPWLAKALSKINNEVWQFAIKGLDMLGDPPIVLKYLAQDEGFFDWHVDFYHGYASRKLSFVIQLSDENDYEGGELQFFPHDPKTAPKQKGTLIVFPSYNLHRVTAVTKGERLALVGWIHGPSFR